MNEIINPSTDLPVMANPSGERSIPIKVIGFGGAGLSIVSRLKPEGWDKVTLAVADTDKRALERVLTVQEKLLLGRNTSKGLGCGGDPEWGKEAAESSREELKALSEGAELLFLVCGLGGGTGGNAAAILAEEAGKRKALVITFAVMPFSFEARRRAQQANEALTELRRVCAAVIPLANDAVLQVIEDDESVQKALTHSDEWVRQGIRSIWSMLFRDALLAIDFSALKRVFKSRGSRTVYSMGRGSGEQRIHEALESLRYCPLMVMPDFARKADHLLVNIIGGSDLSMTNVREIMDAVLERFGRDLHATVGAVVEEGMQGKIEITVLGVNDTGGSRPRSFAGDYVTPTSVAQQAERKNRKGGILSRKQEEFSFASSPKRGYFEETDQNLYQGEDLDVPTYMRKGIRLISLQ